MPSTLVKRISSLSMFRDIIKSVAKNTSIMYLQQMITWASTFLLMLFLPRYLGPVEFGRFFLAYSIIAIFVLFVQYGGSFLVAKSVSRSPESTDQILVDAIGFRILFAIVACTGLVVFAFLADYPSEVRTLLFILSPLLMLGGMITVLYACYQGRELLKYTSAATITERVFIGLAGVTALLLGAGVVIYSVLVVIGSVLNFLVLASSAKRIVRSIPKFNSADAFRQIKESFPFFLFAIFSTIYYRINSVMLSKMAPEHVMGWFGGAYRLFDTLNFFPYIFTVAVFPVLARLWKQDEQVHKRTTQKSLEFMVMVGILVSVGVMGFADKIIQLFCGLREYGPSVIVLQILSTGLLFLYIDMILGTTLMSSDRQMQLSVVSLIMIPVNVGLNYVLIPYAQSHYGNGGIGCAIATASTEICVMISMLQLMPRGILNGFRTRVIFKSLLAGLLTGGCIFLIRLMDPLWIVAVFAGPVVYLVTLFALRTFEPAEEAFLRSMLTVRNMEGFRRAIGRNAPERI